MTSPATPELLHSWDLGVRAFRVGRYWQAHEYWEHGWTRLDAKTRLQLQICIQVAGALHLWKVLGRKPAALRLVAAALEKVSALREQGGASSVKTRVEIQGATRMLERWVKTGNLPSTELKARRVGRAPKRRPA